MINKKKKVVVFDIETNSLNNPTELWCVVIKEIEGGDVTYSFTYPVDRNKFIEYAQTVDTWIGHNCIHYDCKWLEYLLDTKLFNERNVIDTLVLSRLLWVGRPDGHSLEAWGKRLKFAKGSFDDFSRYSNKMLEYCRQDVALTERVYERLIAKMDEDRWGGTLDVEHRIAWLSRSMHEHGFYFNIDEANRMLDEVTARTQELYNLMVDEFPPKVVEIQLKTKVRVDTIPFNPGSPKQVVERLNEFGWSPVEKTKGHILAERERSPKLPYFKEYGWKVNERNLETLHDGAPKACELLVEWLLTDARRRTLTEWINVYNAETGCIHGDFNPLGTVTQRWVHSKPNMGNIPTAKTIKYNSPHLRELAIDYGRRMRQLWTCPDDSLLVGVDMESAHLRIFGHLINDKDFINALCNGDKKDGTDPHSLNKKKLGDLCIDRDRAKTFIFTFLNGGGSSKVAEIFNCNKKQAKEALDSYIESYPGLKYLKEEVIPADARRGYCEGVDGRYIICDSAHHMMGVYLQSAEAIIMKYSMLLMCDKLSQVLDKMNVSYHIVNTVHDEVIIELQSTCESLANYVGQLCSECITEIGIKFKYNCPLAGEYKVGKTWYDVH